MRIIDLLPLGVGVSEISTEASLLWFPYWLYILRQDFAVNKFLTRTGSNKKYFNAQIKGKTVRHVRGFK
jgi:hypothetical protein